ncbi:cupin domain-containing protein [Hymenobacter sp. GOD-10R]|uniref:cupin domain-containing protein n=1 Tax=Hymenobacter sp. GOD-10R TaxID=3093922 RepID=UPI002D785C47|nr:cupin domain-containing protein [Hymenobacter sp. GOD-10R]WRQ30870.1 cupin domain-containing protein [Hymenobacter sp. GOD-10R]
MKTPLLAVGALVVFSFGFQTDTSLPSGVYSGTAQAVKKDGGRESQQLAKGSTLDLAELAIHTSTLGPGQTNHPLQAYNDAEELVVVKEGSLTATVKDSTKTLGPGGLALIVAGDKQSFKNATKAPVTYYVLKFKAKDPVDIQRGQAGGGSFVKDWSKFKMSKTDKGETRPVFDQPSSMFKRFDVHATVLNPGKASHPPHTHRTEEIILMTKGSGEMLIDKTPHKATAGDVILLRSNVPHAFTNTGTTPCGYFAIQWHSNAETNAAQH